MRYLIFLCFLTSGCALSPVGPLDGLDGVHRRPAALSLPPPPAPRPTKAFTQVKTEDIHLGMGAENVRNLWGRPEEIQFAGATPGGYQRWVYVKDIPTSDGYVRQRRIVYFERNRVVGWETQGL